MYSFTVIYLIVYIFIECLFWFKYSSIYKHYWVEPYYTQLYNLLINYCCEIANQNVYIYIYIYIKV